MRRRVLLRTGLIGSAVTAVCCFTPILVVLLAGLGLSAALGWLDWVLLPVLAFFLAMTAYGLWLGWRRS
jgi:mercuric ion transport protein